MGHHGIKAWETREHECAARLVHPVSVAERTGGPGGAARAAGPDNAGKATSADVVERAAELGVELAYRILAGGTDAGWQADKHYVAAVACYNLGVSNGKSEPLRQTLERVKEIRRISPGYERLPNLMIAVSDELLKLQDIEGAEQALLAVTSDYDAPGNTGAARTRVWERSERERIYESERIEIFSRLSSIYIRKGNRKAANSALKQSEGLVERSPNKADYNDYVRQVISPISAALMALPNEDSGETEDNDRIKAQKIVESLVTDIYSETSKPIFIIQKNNDSEIKQGLRDIEIADQLAKIHFNADALARYLSAESTLGKFDQFKNNMRYIHWRRGVMHQFTYLEGRRKAEASALEFRKIWRKLSVHFELKDSSAKKKFDELFEQAPNWLRNTKDWRRESIQITKIDEHRKKEQLARLNGQRDRLIRSFDECALIIAPAKEEEKDKAEQETKTSESVEWLTQARTCLEAFLEESNQAKTGFSDAEDAFREATIEAERIDLLPGRRRKRVFDLFNKNNRISEEKQESDKWYVVEAWNDLGVLLSATDRLPDAKEELNKASRKVATEWDIQHNLALVENKILETYGAKRTADAPKQASDNKSPTTFGKVVGLYHDAITLAPAEALPRINLAQLLERTGKHEAARLHFAAAQANAAARRGVDALHDLKQCIYGQARVLERLGRFKEAADILEAHHTVEPENAGIELYLGLLKLRQGMVTDGDGHEQALIHVRRSRDVAASSKTSHDDELIERLADENEGFIYRCMGLPRIARSYFERCKDESAYACASLSFMAYEAEKLDDEKKYRTQASKLRDEKKSANLNTGGNQNKNACAENYIEACFNTLIGDTDKAFESLEKALIWQPGIREWCRVDPDFKRIAHTKRFQELLGPKRKPAKENGELAVPPSPHQPGHNGAQEGEAR